MTNIKLNQVVDIEINDLSHSGEGVGRVDNFAVFVPGAVPGDVISARIISSKKTYARALPIHIKQPSAKRVDPLCIHHNLCGGCGLQHFDYSEQLQFKHNLVLNALQRIGGFSSTEVLVHPVIGMDEPWFYRNKAQVPVAGVLSSKDIDGNHIKGEYNLVAGFYEKRSHRVVDVKQCHIQHSGNNSAVEAVKNVLRSLNVSPYDEKKHRGIIRHIMVRTSFSKDEVMVVLVTNGEHLPKKKRITEMISEQVPHLTGIVQNVNAKKGNTILGDKDILIWGRPYIEDSLNGLRFHISPRSFYQVNPPQTEKLYHQVLKYAGLTGEETVFDLYCGIGTISLFMARAAKQVIGVEIEKSAIIDARKNTALNDIVNAHFRHGKAENIVPDLIEEGFIPDLVVIDPPRKGCDEALLKTIINSSVPRVIYVSCNPATLARDLKILSEQGDYVLQEIQPVDMFPHTSHVETVCLLTRK